MFVRNNLFRPESGMCRRLRFLFHPDAHVQYIFKRVLAHYLFYWKRIIAWFPEKGLASRRSESDPVFINIVHACGQPSFFIGAKRQVKARNTGAIRSWLKGIKVHIDVVEAILVIMPQNQKHLVRGCRVFYRKCKWRLVAVFPCMPWNGHRFFIKVRSSTGRSCEDQQAGDDQGMKKFSGSFQEIVFCKCNSGKFQIKKSWGPCFRRVFNTLATPAKAHSTPVL